MYSSRPASSIALHSKYMCSDHDRQPSLVHTQKSISYLHCSTSLWTLITDGVKWLLELCNNYFKNLRHVPV